MAVGRLSENGADLCSQSTISRLENLPGPVALKCIMAAMVDLFCDSLTPKASFWCDAQFDTLRLGLIKVAARVTEMVTRIKVSLPTSFPYQKSLAMLAVRTVKLPP